MRERMREWEKNLRFVSIDWSPFIFHCVKNSPSTFTKILESLKSLNPWILDASSSPISKKLNIVVDWSWLNITQLQGWRASKEVRHHRESHQFMKRNHRSWSSSMQDKCRSTDRRSHWMHVSKKRLKTRKILSKFHYVKCVESQCFLVNDQSSFQWFF